MSILNNNNDKLVKKIDGILTLIKKTDSAKNWVLFIIKLPF